jgi:hypothetical protein
MGVHAHCSARRVTLCGCVEEEEEKEEEGVLWVTSVLLLCRGFPAP